MRGHAVKERRSNSTGLIPGTADLLGWYKADSVASGLREIVVVDSFPDADGTNVNGKATATGQTWQLVTGTADINAGKMRPLASGPPSMTALIDLGYPDFDMSAVITIGHANIDGLIFRYLDGNNYFRLALDTGEGWIVLIVNVAGTETAISNIAASGIAIGQTGTLRVRCSGDSIKAWWNGVLTINQTHTAHGTRTKHGLLGYSSATRFDNFSLVYEPVINTWEDRSGLSANLTASAAAKPIMRWNRCNGLPMVEFDGVDDYIGRTANPFGTGSVQILVVAIWRTAGRAVVGGFADKHALADTTSFWRLSNGTGLTVANTITPPLNQPVIMGYRFDGGAAGRLSTDRRQTGETLSGVGGVGAVTAWGIGGSNSSGGPPPNVFFSGWVGEVIIYDRELTEPERVGIIEYLASKWLGRSWA